MCGSKNFITVDGKQRLIGRHHMLTRGDSPHDEFSGNAVAADQLHDDVDIRGFDDRTRIPGDFSPTSHDPLGPIEIQIGNPHNLNGTSRTSGNLIGIARQNGERACAHGARTEQADAHGRTGLDSGVLWPRHHAAARGIRPSRRNMSRTPRTA